MTAIVKIKTGSNRRNRLFNETPVPMFVTKEATDKSRIRVRELLLKVTDEDTNR